MLASRQILVSTIGLDIAEGVTQVHGVDGSGTVVIGKRVSRAKMLDFIFRLPSQSMATAPAGPKY
jgi:hypothetical protein